MLEDCGACQYDRMTQYSSIEVSAFRKQDGVQLMTSPKKRITGTDY